MNIKIATILTVHNRKQKTLSCLQHLYEALDAHNQFATNPIVLTVFLTDDGCTDGTADAIRLSFPTKGIQILQGSGSLFWAGGMRLAWQAAIDEGTPWDYYLLLNDDTLIYDNVFEELFAADNYGYQLTGRVFLQLSKIIPRLHQGISVHRVSQKTQHRLKAVCAENEYQVQPKKLDK